MNEKHEKMIESFKKRYTYGLDSWTKQSYLKDCITVFLEKYSDRHFPEVFEVGIGSGISSEQILERDSHLTGIDVAQNDNWPQLKEKWGNKFNAYEADIINYTTDLRYDLIIDNGCFHHLEPSLYEITLHNVYQLMHVNSIYFLAVFKETDPDVIEGHTELIDAGTRRCKFFTSDEITALLENHSFRVSDQILVPRNFGDTEVIVCVCEKITVT